jgi:hypothetical protein
MEDSNVVQHNTETSTSNTNTGISTTTITPTQTLHETQHTIHQIHSTPKQKLDISFHNFLQHHRPHYAEDDAHWHVITKHWLEKHYDNKWKLFAKFCNDHQVHPLTNFSTTIRTAWANYTQTLTKAQTQSIQQIQTSCLPYLTSENDYYTLLQKLIQMNKPASDIFSVRGDEYQILKIGLEQIDPFNEKRLILRAMITFMLDTASRTKDLRAIDHRTFSIHNNKLLFQFAYEGEHITKEASIYKNRSTHTKRKHSAYIELTEWATKLVVPYWAHIRYKLPQKIGFFLSIGNKSPNFISDATIKKQIQNFIDSTLLKSRTLRITPHKLKHITVSEWRAQEVDIKDIADRSRTSIQTLETHYITDTKRANRIHRQDIST